MKSRTALVWALLPWICNTAGAGETVYLDTPEGMNRLVHSEYKAPFEALDEYYTPQLSHLCGPTSAVIVLNSLSNSDKYDLFNFFTPETNAIKTRAEIEGVPGSDSEKPHPGLSLAELDEMLKTIPSRSVQTTFATSSLSDSKIRKDLVGYLSQAKTYVIINFWRPALFQKGGGHFSPIAAYDLRSDSFLLLDVNARMGFYWVPSAELIYSMRHFSGATRGYLVVR